MILWALQMFLNLVLSYFAFMWLVSKKRISWLEAQTEMLNQTIKQLVSQVKKESSSVENTPSATSNKVQVIQNNETQVDRGQLIEKFLQTSDPRRNLRPSPEAYDRADQLISRGVGLNEVARQTGLSVAELQLMGKVASRVQ